MNSTIFACATPPGRSAIAVIRVSGDKTFSIIETIFRSHEKISKVEGYRIIYGEIYDWETNSLVDEVLIAVYRQPKSYTGEDMVEIFCHGGYQIIKKISDLLTKAGACLAKPGEFTKRRFLNGKIDLVQAEALLSLVSAQTEKQAKAALAQLTGAVSKKIYLTIEQLEEALARVEYGIEFASDEEFLPLQEQLNDQLRSLSNETKLLLEQGRRQRFLTAGVKCVIAGRTNVGKSSLFNQILGKERAIVTEIPGTTRDAIEATIEIESIPCTFFDTAGVDIWGNKIDDLSIEKSQAYISNADLLLLVFDSAQPPKKEDIDLLTMTKGKNRILVLNKKDLPYAFSTEVFDGEPFFLTSAKFGEGIEELLKKVKEKFIFEDSGCEEFYPTQSRHLDCLEKAYSSLNNCLNNQYWEIIAYELRSALKALKEIVGEERSEDVLERIFSQFCIGK